MIASRIIALAFTATTAFLAVLFAAPYPTGFVVLVASAAVGLPIAKFVGVPMWRNEPVTPRGGGLAVASGSLGMGLGVLARTLGMSTTLNIAVAAMSTILAVSSAWAAIDEAAMANATRIRAARMRRRP